MMDFGEEAGLPDVMTPEIASQELSDYLIFLKHSHVLSAQQRCLTAHWIAQIHPERGFLSRLAYPPGRQTGKYSAHLDTVLEKPRYDERYYDLMLPQHRRSDATRVNESISVVPIHEALVREFEENIHASIEHLDRLEELPASYHTHPVVLEAPYDTVVHALVLFVDGLPFTRHDGCISFFFYSVFTKRRHLVVSLRKQDMCRCGCRGWCSLFYVFKFLCWTSEALKSGELSKTTSRQDTI